MREPRTPTDHHSHHSPAVRISYALARLHQVVFAGVVELAARHDLTALQFTTLSVLGRHGEPLSSSQLARRSFMTAQSMHDVIHRLEAQALIKRSPHPNHGRKLPASLTAKGRRVLAACEAALTEFETTMLRSFSTVEREAFLGLLKAAVHNLGAGFGDGVASGVRDQPDAPRALARARKSSPRLGRGA